MVYEISESKALMGACFIHYLIYSVFYSIDAIKTAASDNTKQESDDPNVRRAKEQARKRQENAARGENPSAMDMKGQTPSPGGPGANPRTNEFDTISNKKPVGAKAEDGLDMKDIELRDVNEEQKHHDGIGPGPSAPRESPKNEDEEEHEEDLDGYDDEGMPFFNQVVNRFPKGILWYFLI